MFIRRAFALIMFYSFLICLGFSSVAHASEEMGQAVMNGKSITVFSDGTWKFSEEVSNSAALQTCREIKSKKVAVTICLSPDRWRNETASDSYEFMFTHKIDEIYAGLIPEKIYIPVDVLRTAIIANAASAMSLGQPEIVDEGTVEFSDQTWNYIDYSAKISDIEFFFKIYYVSSRELGSVQFALFSSKANAALVQKAAKEISLRIDQ